MMMVMVTQARRAAVAHPQQAADDDGKKNCEYVIPGRRAEERKRKTKEAPMRVPRRRSREAVTVAPTFDCITMMALMDPQ